MPLTRTIRLDELSDEIREYSRQNIETSKAAVVAGVARSIPHLVRTSPVDTGRYANSWDMIATDLAVTIGNFAPHSPIIEIGARPFRPPLTPLLAWAKRVLGDPSQPEEGYSDQVWALAIHTQRKIEREGIAPRHVMGQAIETIVKNIEEEFKIRG